MLSPLPSLIQLAPARELHVCPVADNNAYGASPSRKLTPIAGIPNLCVCFQPSKMIASALPACLHKPEIPFKTHNRTLPNLDRVRRKRERLPSNGSI
jgi:hypothetical protein